MINAVIVEDEKKSREVLEALVKTNCPDVNIVGMAESVAQGEEVIRSTKPRLVFLDIEMADGSGFDLLERVPNSGFEVIFTTASDAHALRAIKYSAIDYLLKPIDADELKTAVEKIRSKQLDTTNIESLKFLLQNFRKPNEQYSKITLPTGNAYEIINVKDIIRCEADGSYTSFFLENKKKLLVSASLKHYEDILPADDFIRVHHHHLINMNHVVRFLKTDGGYAVMSDGAQIEISRRKKDAFLQRLNKV
jgi:two-component system LytT family response regulator